MKPNIKFSSNGFPETLIEIAGYPPPPGAYSMRINFVTQQWKQFGHRYILMNIGGSRKLNNPKYLNIKGPVDFIVRVAKAAANGCIIHTHTNAKGIKGNFISLCAQFISIIFGRRCVLTFHAGVKQHYFPKTGFFLKDTIVWLLFKTPRFVICNSQDVKDRIVEEYGIKVDKVFPIPAFCPAYMETPMECPSADITQFIETHHSLLVSYVFFFHPEFTVDLMIKAVNKLRDEFADLGLIIMGSKQYADSYEKLIDQLNLKEHILLTGNLPRSEFLHVLSRAQLYLRTPIGDGVASSVLEALSMGIPVVASDNGTRPESCVLYEACNLTDMVQKIRLVLTRRERILKKLVKPEENDTIEREMEVLLSV